MKNKKTKFILKDSAKEKIMGMIANYQLVNENELERMRELVEGGKASDLMGYIEIGRAHV